MNFQVNDIVRYTAPDEDGYPLQGALGQVKQVWADFASTLVEFFTRFDEGHNGWSFPHVEDKRGRYFYDTDENNDSQYWLQLVERPNKMDEPDPAPDPAPENEVLIAVSDGVAELVHKPDHVRVVIRDFDEGPRSCSYDLDHQHEANGAAYTEEVFDAD